MRGFGGGREGGCSSLLSTDRPIGRCLLGDEKPTRIENPRCLPRELPRSTGPFRVGPVGELPRCTPPDGSFAAGDGISRTRGWTASKQLDPGAPASHWDIRGESGLWAWQTTREVSRVESSRGESRTTRLAKDPSRFVIPSWTTHSETIPIGSPGGRVTPWRRIRVTP